MNEEKEGENEKPRIRKLSSHSVRALCPNSEMMREKRRKRERKRYGQKRVKREVLREVKRMKDFAFLRIWHFTSSHQLFQGNPTYPQNGKM